jgi:SH3-like domain-containing protein
MRAYLIAGLLALSGSISVTAAWGQEASIEEQAEGAREAMAPLPEADPDAEAAPRDPTKGAVTNLPIPRYVSLKGNEGNARRGPGLTHRIDWVFTREGMPLKITAEYEHWRRVEDADGAGGWVHYMLLSGVRSVLVTQDMAEAHSAPDDGSEVLFQNELNVVGRLVQCVPDWCRIMVEGEKGWVHASALWGVTSGEIFP